MALNLRPIPAHPFQTRHAIIWDNIGALPQRSRLYQHQVDATRAVVGELFPQDPPDNDVCAVFPNVSLVVLPTGTGKSGVAVLAAYCCNVEKVLVVTPSVAISEQIFNDFQGDTPFLQRCGVFLPEDRQLYIPAGRLIQTTAELLPIMQGTPPLVVVNAQKFGANTNVDLGQVPTNFPLVIIDEAHHYPAATWRNIVQHFVRSKILFLTATPFHRVAAGQNPYILGRKLPCYNMSRADAVAQHIIRDVDFEETGEWGDDRQRQIMAVVERMKGTLELQAGNAQPNNIHYKGLILASNVAEAHDIALCWNNGLPAGHADARCAAYVRDVRPAVVEDFKAGRYDALVVIYRLTEGFDHKNVSVVGILRNVQPASTVYFSQFIGRAVRKLDANDAVQAMVISHRVHEQRANFNHFLQEHEFVADADPEDNNEGAVGQ